MIVGICPYAFFYGFFMNRVKRYIHSLDWNTELDYWAELFSFKDKFLCLFLERNVQLTSSWLLWVHGLNNDNSYLLQYFQQCIQ